MAEEDARLKALSLLLQLEKEARSAETLTELSYLIANDTRQVLPCEQNFVWTFNEVGAPKVERASNVSDVDSHSVKVRWLNRLLKWCLSQEWHRDITFLTVSDVPDDLTDDWEEYLGDYVMYMPLAAAEFHSGCLMSSKVPWTEAHKALAEILSDSYAHAWKALRKPDRKRELVSHLKRRWWRYAIVLVIIFLYPVRQYVLAPAQVVPAKPYVISAPLTGVVDEVAVTPGQTVQKGSLLFSMKATELKNNLILAKRSLDVVQAKYRRNAQASFHCDDCRAKAAQLKAEMKREKAKVVLAQQQLERSRVHAPIKGVAVFSDVNDWNGKPVQVGEKVMEVADPEKTALKIELPVADAIAIDDGAEVIFYPNISPLSEYTAHINQTSYAAEVTDSQQLAYKLQAGFSDAKPRLGLRGTAKIYGSRAPVIYLLLRKPLSWLRRSLGF